MKYDDLVYLMKKEGRAEGKAEGKAEAVIELLEELGALPEELKEEILSKTDIAVLKKWLIFASKAKNLKEWEAMVQTEDN